MKAVTVGEWTVLKGTVISPDGSTEVTVINDGSGEWHTAQDPAHLIVALMQLLDITHIGPA